jgi:polyisoprenoid-binding protein YceI
MTTAAAVSTSPSPLATPVAAVTPSTRWTLDPAHSHVSFSVRHMMISNVRGEFSKVTGQASYDASNPAASQLSVSIDVASINTREEKRDAHLRSADFFDVENHPTMTFVSKTVRPRGDGLEVVGQLTIRGTSREVTLGLEEITPQFADPWGNLRIGASARTKVRRSDFGMRWNAALEAGGVLVGDEVSIQIEAELILDK